jgi:hypothetical protein
MSRAVEFSIGSANRARTSKATFARHFAEMLLVMFIGMGALAGLAQLALGASGTGLSDQTGELQVILMGLSMTAPMVAWMAYRGHANARSAEMAASMLVPTAIAAILAWAGTTDTETALGVQHSVMIPAMLGVMLWRYTEYARRGEGSDIRPHTAS